MVRGEKVCALNGARCKGIEYRGRGVQSDIGGACETDFAPPTPCLSSKTVTSSSSSQFFVDVTTLPFRCGRGSRKGTSRRILGRSEGDRSTRVEIGQTKDGGVPGEEEE